MMKNFSRFREEKLKSNILKEDVDYLFTPRAIRETTHKILEMCKNGETHFILHEDKVDACAEFVLEVTKENYPKLDIPFHSRWGHFKVGGIDREKILESKISESDKIEQARVKLELAITSVLLDAGAGPDWKYTENDLIFNRSEGLAVASFHLFMEGKFSEGKKIFADAKGLSSFKRDDLTSGFQVSDSNPLVGIDGRVDLINKLGEVVANNPEYFPNERLGGIIDYLVVKHGPSFEVGDILDVVLRGLGGIWPGRLTVDGINLGDVWQYAPFEKSGSDGVVCFHKLSQWLTYSLVGPMVEAGLNVTGAEKLTGLAEYRNGGLFLDFGVIELRDKELLEISHKPNSELIIEWRALTIQLLDQVGEKVQKLLGKSSTDFPLAKVLEGGTWWAGRKIAKAKRPDLTPPIKLDSDGTVF